MWILVTLWILSAIATVFSICRVIHYLSLCQADLRERMEIRQRLQRFKKVDL